MTLLRVMYLWVNMGLVSVCSRGSAAAIRGSAHKFWFLARSLGKLLIIRPGYIGKLNLNFLDRFTAAAGRVLWRAAD